MSLGLGRAGGGLSGLFFPGSLLGATFEVPTKSSRERTLCLWVWAVRGSGYQVYSSPESLFGATFEVPTKSSRERTLCLWVWAVRGAGSQVCSFRDHYWEPHSRFPQTLLVSARSAARAGLSGLF